ncbi:MAG: asparaginase [Betaproteobacteria bacterium]|jgi:L-asparaginase|nr:asparaginase [Betaproteobacteria bacterium]
MASNEPLVFLSCGGTIEKIYLPEAGRLGFDRSRIADWAERCRITAPWRAETVMLIDSLEMVDHDRQQLGRKIAQTPESRVIVLHGTDTMADSAKAVMLQRKEHQVIVFTGAMVPASFEKSDALFNFGFACAAVQFLQPGTYIAMNGKIFLADRAQKNIAAGRFEEPTPAPNAAH